MKKIGYLFTGLALGVAISAVSPVMASAVKTISAKVNNTVSVVLNGEKVQLKTQPIEYNNLNYLPVGEIGRALGLGVSYDKTKDAINITSQEQTGSTSPTPAQTTTPPDTSEPVATLVQKVKLGEPITRDGITVKIDKIEYMSNGEIIGNLKFSGGYKVNLTIENNSPDNITNLGSLFEFKTDSALNDKIINGFGNTLIMKVNGQELKGSTLNTGETASGYLYYQTNQEFNIKEITYYPNINNIQSSKAFGKWIL